VLLTAVVLGGGAYALGLRAGSAAAVGLALALSSTAVVMRVLEEQQANTSPSGRLSFSVLLAQDLALIPILFGLAAISSRYEADFTTQLLRTYVPAALIMGGMILGSRLLLRPLLRIAARAQSRELFIAACLFVVLVTGLLAESAGLSMALGAFVAGLLLAETEYQREVEVTLDPFKGLFLGAFFLSVGIQLNIGVLLREPLLILGVVAAMMAVKLVLVAGLARLFGAPLSVALQSGMLLAAGGEFAFVILGAAGGADLIEPGPAQIALVAATLSMFTIPIWAWLAQRLGSFATKRSARPRSATHPSRRTRKTPRRRCWWWATAGWPAGLGDAATARPALPSPR
jgi:CPA2 family monovalent cation:H+ antiporter-2